MLAVRSTRPFDAVARALRVAPVGPSTTRSKRANGRVLVAVALALMAITTTGATIASAATLCVDNTNPCSDGTGVPCYCTIGAAITAAVTAVDTINVAAGGTYAENVVLNKNLILNGGQAGVPACGRSATESTITPGAGTTGILLITGSAGSTINGFTISGGARGIESATGPINNLSILNNRMVGFSGSGIFLNDNGTDINVDQNYVDGTSKITSGDLVHLDTDGFNGFRLTNNCIQNGVTATGFFVDGAHNVNPSATRVPVITGNLISKNQTGMNLGSRAFGGSVAMGNATISGNTITNNVFDGVQGGIQRTNITDNLIAMNGRNGLSLTSFGSAVADRGGQNDTITLNCVLNNGFGKVCAGGVNVNLPCTADVQCPASTCSTALLGSGLFFSAAQAAGTISTNVANNNNIESNRAGATYLGAETINGENDWWGCPTGANTAGCDTASPNVDTVPFLAAPQPGTACATITQCTLDGWEIANFDATTSTETGDATTTSGTDSDFVSGPATPPLGAGSLGQVVGTNGDDATRLRTGNCNGMLLSDVVSTPFSYWTYVTANSIGQATYIQLRVDQDGNGSTDDRLFFEPVYQNGGYGMIPPFPAVPNQCALDPINCVVLNTWQFWDARVGGWWSDNESLGGPPLITLANYIVEHPGVRVATDNPSLRVQAGGGAPPWNNFDGAADDLTACGETYNFELGVCPTPTPTPTPTVTATPTATDTATPTPTDTATDTPTPTATITPGCGNGILEGGETCDPPGSFVAPNGNECNTNCTFCGDGIINGTIQLPETCDDGNSDQCDPIHPQKPVAGDTCNNQCAGLICKDPSKIKLTSGIDMFKSHGVIVPFENESIDFTVNGVSLTLTSGQVQIFQTSLLHDVVATLTNGGFKYKNRDAKLNGGVYMLTARPTRDGTFKLSIVSYGDLSQASGDMVTHIGSGGREWTVHAIWRQTGSGWVFDHAL
jgi:hypothetical protein